MQKLYSLASDNSTAGGTICVAIAPEPLAMVPTPSCKRLANCPDEITARQNDLAALYENAGLPVGSSLLRNEVSKELGKKISVSEDADPAPQGDASGRHCHAQGFQGSSASR
jgi:hypothetical protein